MALHKAGQFAAAANVYEQVLAQTPNDPQVLYLAGGAYAQSGRPQDAIPRLERSLALRRSFAPGLELLGSIWAQTGAPEKAVAYFREAAALTPTSAGIFAQLGNALAQGAQYAESAKAFEKALQLDASNRQARLAYAAVLSNLGRGNEAESILRRYLAEAPDENAFITLGSLLGQRERYADAEVVFRDCIARYPTSAAALQLLGHALHKQGRLTDAEAAYRAALALTPNDAKLLERLGETLTDLHQLDDAEALLKRGEQLVPNGSDRITALGRIEELRGNLDNAVTLHTRALEIDPRNPSAYLNRGNAQRFSGDFEGALADYDQALVCRPGMPAANANRALTFLTLGRLSEGWPLYQARIRALHGAADLSAGKSWDGSSLVGKRLLVWNEYGLGDEILFASLFPELLKIAAHCTMVCAPRLVTLFQRSFPSAHIVPAGAPIAGEFDFHLPLIDVAQTLRPSLESFSPHEGYLRADADLTATLQARYRTGGSLTVGISWHSAAGPTGRFKSSDLMQWREVLTLPGVRFVSLQYGDHAADIARVNEALGCEIFVDPEVTPNGDLDPFAAQVAATDIVVSVSNTTVHVAGALGKPVLVLVPTGPGAHWYWLQKRTDSPWYPSARLYRAGRGELWTNVLGDIAEALRDPRLIPF